MNFSFFYFQRRLVNTWSVVFCLDLEEFLNSVLKILNHCWLKEILPRIFIPVDHVAGVKAALLPEILRWAKHGKSRHHAAVSEVVSDARWFNYKQERVDLRWYCCILLGAPQWPSRNLGCWSGHFLVTRCLGVFIHRPLRSLSSVVTDWIFFFFTLGHILFSEYAPLMWTNLNYNLESW